MEKGKAAFLLLSMICLFMVHCNMPIKTEHGLSYPPLKKNLAENPPMGWNSWDCLGWTANEQQVKANADYMSKHFKHLGYTYIVIDQGWFADSSSSDFDAFVHEKISKKPTYHLDGFGRLLPDTIKFPSSVNGKGFKPLADYIHSFGLKFGVHLLRGIPWSAASEDILIKDTKIKTITIAEPDSGCVWYDGFYGVNMSKPGAQEYYNSVFELFAEWGVDFVKADDMVNKAELLAISRAIRTCGRDMVLSVVPDQSFQGNFLIENCHMARTGYDYWDVWEMLKQAFPTAHQHTKFRGNGFWPDLDMLPVGKIGKKISYKGPFERVSNFNEDELKTLLSLWYISKSPLFIGGYLPETDSLTLKLLTNQDAVEVNRLSSNNRQIKHRNAITIWAADKTGTEDKYLAMFNLWETVKPVQISFEWKEVGLAENGRYRVYDIWNQKDLGFFEKGFSEPIKMHGAGLYKISPN